VVPGQIATPDDLLRLLFADAPRKRKGQRNLAMTDLLPKLPVMGG
jgi:hypothetical protein